MFARKGITGIAAILGSASGGLACRDFDDAGAYHHWAAEHPDLAAVLPTVQTARGFHIYFLGPEAFKKLGDGEYRASNRQYCLLPPSRHPDGVLYRWLIPLPDGALPCLDPAQARLLAETQAATQAETQAHPPPTLHVSDDGIEATFLATLPTGPGQRNRALWNLARRLKGVMPGATIDTLEGIIRAWHTRALPAIATKDWQTTWMDFRFAWSRVRRPVGATMAAIVAAAKAQTPADADIIARLVALCQSLQTHHGDGKAWPLSCRKAAEFIGVGHDKAARLLKMLRFEEVIELVTVAGTKHSKRAAEYRFIKGTEQ